MNRFTSDMSWRDLIEALHALGLELQSLEYLQSIFRPDIAITAKEFETPKSVTLTGDVTGTDSSKAGWTVNTTLADTGVDPGQVGTYLDAEPYYGERFTVPNFKVDSKGRLTEVRETYVAIPHEVHDETKMVVGSSSSREHAATTNGNTFINIFDTHTYQDGTIEDLHRTSIGISGSGATAVASNASGGIVISSTDTNTMMIQNASTGDNTYPILLVATANASASLGAKTAIFGAGVKVNPKTSTVVATKFQGALAGNAATATQFTSAQSVTLTGDVTGTSSSQAGWSIATTLKNSGVAAGSYGQAAKASPGYGKTFNVPYITVNEKGIITEAYTFAVTMPADSHWTTKAILGASDSTVNAATTNGNTCFRIFDDSTARASFSIVGAGATTVASDASGKLTITSTDTNTLMTQSVSSADNTYPILLVAAANATANQGAKPAIFGSGVKVNPKTSTIIAAKFQGVLVGNADTTTKLKTTRAINGTNFDGTADITTTTWGTARDITIKDADNTNAGATVSVNGSQAYILNLPSTIKATLTGNASTATTLKTARTIWGQSFNGSNNISGAMTDVGPVTFTSTPSGSTTNLIYANMGGNDYLKIAVGGADDQGWAEIATGDNGDEPIYVRQYKHSGSTVTVNKQVTLLDASGNSTFPGTVTATKFVGAVTGNATTATKFASAQAVTLTGDVTGTASSTAGWSIATTLANSGVTAGSYGPSANATPGYGATFNVPYITVDAKGRVTAASTMTVKVPADSHWTTKAVLGSTGGTVNAATTNGNTYFSIFDNSTTRASFNIVGAGATTVASDANGKLTITSTDTNTLMTQSVSTANNTYPVLLVATANATANLGAKTAIFGTKVKVNPSTGAVTCADILTSGRISVNKGDAPAVGSSSSVLDVAYMNADSSKAYSANVISYIGTNGTDGYNTPIRMGSSNGTTIISAGESGPNFAKQQGKYNDEHIYLVADGSVIIYTNGNNEATSFADPITFSNGTITAKSISVSGGLTGNASSATKLATARSLWGNNFDGTANLTSTITVSGNVNQFIASQGGYHFLIRNDGSVTYFLLSAKNGTAGSWTTARPITIDNATGICNINGNAATATKFSAAQSVTLTGDVTGSASSQAGWSIATTLKNSGVTAGSYGPSANATPAYGATFNVPYITVDAKGRVTAASTKTVKIPADSHWTTKAILGASDSTANAATTNGNTYFSIFDNTTSRASFNLVGAGATTVASDANGKLTITSTDTNTLMTQSVSTANNTYPILLVASANATANLGAKTAIFGSGVKVNPSTSTITATAINVNTVTGLPKGTTWVAGVTQGQALINATTTGYGAIWNAPTKNYRVGCSTYPSNSDVVHICYSVTNANVTAGTNTTHKTLTWDAGTGALNASGGFGGNAATATKFSANQSVALTGDVTGSASSQAGWSVATTLANSGVTAGSYGPSANATPAYGATFNVPYITVDAKGRVTAASTKTVKIPADSHWTTKAILGASDSTANAATTNGNTYFKIFDNSTARSTFNLVGAGATTVASDANGKLTITSTDTNTLMTQNVSTANNTYPILLVAAANATANQGAKTAIFGSGVKVNPNQSMLIASVVHAAAVELAPGSTSATNGGYLDFHYGASTADYTSRIIEDQSGRLSLNNNTKITSTLVVVPAALGMQKAGFTKGTNPSSTTYWTFTCCDQGGTNYTNNCLGMFETSVDANGVVRTYIRALANKAASTSNCQITCLYDTANDTGYTSAPTPAAGDNSTKIATTAWVRNATGSTKLKSDTSGVADQAKLLRPVAISNGNYSDVLVINCSENSAANRCSVIRVTNGDGYNDLLLGVCNESNGAPGGISVRNTNGTFTVNLPGTTTGTFKGNVTGNCSGSSGSCTGNAATATKLATARQINGVNFDGTANITIADSTKLPIAGGTLTGDVSIHKANPTLYLRNTNKTRGTAPSATVGHVEINGRDNANKNTWGIYQTYATDKAIMTYLITYKGTTTDNAWTGLGIGYDGSGNIVSSAPTPAAGDNSTKIATTAWVHNATGNTSLNAATATTAATANKVQADLGTGSFVASIKLGAALVNDSSSKFAALWNAPTKNYRVGCATHPDAGDTVYLCYSITNANVSSSTNTVARSLTWNADTGILATVGFSGNLTGNCSGTASNVTGVVAIANGGTGATTRLNAIKALTNENVSTNATHFLGLKSDWSKVGYFTLAEAKTLLGLKSAAYTESSAYATSGHTHSYLPLSGGTLTGQLTISKDNGGFGGGIKLISAAQNYILSAIRTDYTKGTAPTATKYWGIDFYGNAPTKYQNRVSMIETTVDANNTSKITLAAYRCSTVDNTGMCSISVSIDKNGNQVTYAPTPAAGDNSTKIATTAWVQTFCNTTKKYLTAHQSLAGYLKTYSNVSELGKYIDMHYDDSTSKYDYDVRIYVASQGSAKGQGALTVAAKSIDFGGTYNNGGTIYCTNKYPLIMKNSSNTSHTWRLMDEDANLVLTSDTNGTWDNYPRLTMTKGGVAQLNVERCVRFQAFNSSPGEAYAVFITGVSESNAMSAVNCDWAFAGSNSNGGSSASSNHKLGGFHVYAKESTRRAQLLVKDCGGGTTEYAWELELAGTIVNANFRTNGRGGYVKPANDNLINLGKSDYRWTQVFANASAISTSDARKKDQIALLPDEVLDAWNNINWKQYKMKDSIAEKGIDAARTHAGIIAQEVQEVFKAKNLDASKYGFFCHDEWDEVPDEVTDEANNKVNPGHPAGDVYSIRYEEALCIEAAYQRRRADRAEARILKIETENQDLKDRLSKLEALVDTLVNQ